MWVFLASGICMFANAMYTFYHAAEWSHYISASHGQVPWNASSEAIQHVMHNTRDEKPTEADFVLFNSMLSMGALMLVLSLVFFGHAKSARLAVNCKWPCAMRIARCKGGFCFFVFGLCYLGLRSNSHAVMDVVEVLANNGTVPLHNFTVPHERPKTEHNPGAYDPYNRGHREEWEFSQAERNLN